MGSNTKKFVGGKKYAKRVYLDEKTDQQLREIARELGFTVQRGPTTGEGSTQALLIALCELGTTEAVLMLEELRVNPH